VTVSADFDVRRPEPCMVSSLLGSGRRDPDDAHGSFLPLFEMQNYRSVLFLFI
jgi:hypothetical protein